MIMTNLEFIQDGGLLIVALYQGVSCGDMNQSASVGILYS